MERIGWVKKKLGEVATYINGYAFKPTQWEERGIPIIRIQNLNNPNAAYNYYNGELPEKYLVKRGDILISWSASLGAYEWKSEDAYLNQHIFKVDFNKCDIDKYFLKYAVESRLPAMLKDVHGATMQHIVKKDFDNTQIPFPPLPEQQQIVSELDCLQGIIDKKKEQLQELDKLAQSIFYTMFGDTHNTLFPVVLLKDITYAIGDGLHGTPQYVEKSNCHFINGNNLDKGKIVINANTKCIDHNEKQKYFIELDTNTILLSINGTLGKIAFYNGEDVILGKSACYMKLKNDINKIYMYGFLSSDSFQEYARNNATGTTIRNVSLKTIRNTKVPVPPLSLQQEFADKINAIEQQKTRIRQSLQDTETLFQSRMDYYFG